MSVSRKALRKWTCYF